MPETSTLTIVFRGLMIFHEDKKNKRMEIGRVPAKGHIPRILTIRNGVLASVFDLRRRKNLLEGARVWRIVVENPADEGISLFTDGKEFKRSEQCYNDARDFRWIMDFESGEFYGKDLSGDIDKMRLKPIFVVPGGQFYTRLKSPFLDRTTHEGGSSQTDEFGPVAAVTGCDIKVNDGGVVRLVAVLNSGEEREVFQFENDGNTIYEITNTPPDVDLADPGSGLTHGHGRGDRDEHDGHDEGARTQGPEESDVPAVPRGAQNHFLFYYSLWKRDPHEPTKRFEFELANDPDPAPDPALCGKGWLGTTPESLI